MHQDVKLSVCDLAERTQEFEEDVRKVIQQQSPVYHIFFLLYNETS